MSSPPRSKSKRTDMGSLNLLHSGVKRKVSKHDYVKLFAKIRIGEPKRKSFLPSSNRDSQEEVIAENTRLKLQIKDLQIANSQLTAAVSKENKLQSLICKRIESQDLYELNFEKAMEIKLMLEADGLQEQLKNKQAQLDRTLREHKEREERSKNYDDAAQMELYAILCNKTSQASRIAREKAKIIEQQQEKIMKTKEKTQKIKQIKKVKAEELKQVEKLVEKSKEILPNISKVIDQNDSGVYGTQIRVKTTQTIQKQIEKLHQQCINFQTKIQKLIEQKVKQKIGVLKDINEYETMIVNRQVPMRHFAW